MDCSRDQLLESLSLHAIAPLFNETLEDFIASSSSFSSDLSSDFDFDNETTQILDIINVVQSTRYLEYRQPLEKLGAFLDFCLNAYKSTRPKKF